METVKIPKETKATGINVQALEELAAKFNHINKTIQSGGKPNPELTISFVTFPLSDDPYNGDW